MTDAQRFHDDAAEGRVPAVIEWIKRGVPINCRNPTGGTALMIAVNRSHLDVVTTLLDAGADPNISLIEVTYTALHSAAQGGFEEIARALLDHSAKVDAATQYGETALMSAAYHGNTSMVRLLLSRGADPNLVHKEGHRASDWARKMGHPETAAALAAVEAQRGLISRLLSRWR